MKNTLFLLFLLIYCNMAIGAEPQNQQQRLQVTEPNSPNEGEDDVPFLQTIKDIILVTTGMSSIGITANETTKTSKAYRYRGFMDDELNKDFLNSPLNWFNQEAAYYDFNNMERLEYLKYSLDLGYVPLPPYINWPNYFEATSDSDETFPQIRDIINFREDVCRTTLQCNSSPVSFVRLALYTKVFSKEFDQQVMTYPDLLNLFATLGYTSEDFSFNDLIVLGRLARDLNYIPLWPHLSAQRRYIRDVTDDNFQKEVLDASRDGQLVIVHLYESVCLDCHTIGAIMEDLAREFEGAFTLAKVYIDGNPETRKLLPNYSIPALLFYKDGLLASEHFSLPTSVASILLSPPHELETMKQVLRSIINTYI